MRPSLLRVARYAWTSPNTVVGALLGLCLIVPGGRVRIVSGVMEFSCGLVGRALSRAPKSLRFCAITFGHVVIGINEAQLDAVRPHEHVHVRQYERWGPFFLPAYLLSSVWQILQGRRAYRDNVFEREAYATARCQPVSRRFPA